MTPDWVGWGALIFVAYVVGRADQLSRMLRLEARRRYYEENLPKIRRVVPAKPYLEWPGTGEPITEVKLVPKPKEDAS